MGVNGLWTVVAPTARPTQLASLNRKRLAVDASIWIYQFLKAVRDKEGNALRNSHVVGFFRRICKLLYFGIKPVFVFDGGAPILKRETVRRRARRREGRREDAARTAGKLLAVQVARAAEEEEKKRKALRERTPVEDELPPDQELIYVDEIGMNKQERQAGRTFKRKDQYHLPDLDVSMENMVPNDPRIMSQSELEEYARQFHSGEDINLYDFTKIDFDSPFFLSLPPGDRYNILNAARLRSRLRMGYSKEQLDGMFPDRMAFSKFQIERVKERNELTQRLMHINGMAEDFLNQGGRIAGEKGKEYILVRNDGVEGGWALGVVSNKEGTKKENAIDLEEDEKSEILTNSEDEDFEDVAIEGLNRLPKTWKRKAKDIDVPYDDIATQIAKKRKAVYDARKVQQVTTEKQDAKKNESNSHQNDTGGLFVDGKDSDDDLFEDVDIDQQNDDDLQFAIAMSLQKDDDQSGGFEKTIVEDDDGLDFQKVLTKSRKPEKQTASVGDITFDGPLPFESINLGQSLLGKKKAKQVEENLSGGFDRNLGDDTFRNEKPIQPLPSWFQSAPNNKEVPKDDTDDDDDKVDTVPEKVQRLRRYETKEIIDVDADADDDKDVDENDHDADIDDEPEKVDEIDEVVQEDDQQMIDGQSDEEERKRNQELEKRFDMAREIAAEYEDEDQSSPLQVPQTIAKDEQLRSFKSTTPQSEHDLSHPDEEIIDWSESDQAESPKDSPHENIITFDEDENMFEDVVLNDQALPPVEDSQPEINPELTSQYLLPDNDDEVQDDNQGQNNEYDYLSDSDEELMRQLAIEAEEHARFATSLNNTKTQAEAVRDYENELKQLRNQQKKDRRDADEVTQVMIQECQALLKLFGLPYITAPMEAEAQCAELVHLGLVDGIVTDDSDIFLFGGTRIYKNMFNAAKFVECYLSTDLEKEYALDRKKLIRFAHLLGSDYTEGIPGIGPVSALEILTDFDTLEEFSDWCKKVQHGRPQDLENQLTTPFRRKFRNTVQKRLFLPTIFPDVRVDGAYLNPEVDSNPEEFQWGIPDLDKLRSFLMTTIGWNQERTDEILVPVIRDINKREIEGTQSNLTRFFTGGVGVGSTEGTAPRNRTGKESGRMAKAYTRLRTEAEKKRNNDDEIQIGNDENEVGVEESRKRKR